ncbi:hypothetical protein BJ165DRAFT_1408918 [Panaeolus papilionaceus]|nr:hypothetical protein BJ165DRAFT_1408918 [Panaeolus papilionaceus]
MVLGAGRCRNEAFLLGLLPHNDLSEVSKSTTNYDRSQGWISAWTMSIKPDICDSMPRVMMLVPWTGHCPQANFGNAGKAGAVSSQRNTSGRCSSSKPGRVSWLLMYHIVEGNGVEQNGGRESQQGAPYLPNSGGVVFSHTDFTSPNRECHSVLGGTCQSHIST